MTTDSALETALETTREVVAARSHLAGPLLPILHGVQDALGHVPREVLPEIAAALNLSRAEVHGVVSYYHHFREAPAGRCVVQVCRAESCQAMGADALLDRARADVGCSAAKPTSADGAYTVEPVYCLGLCASSPSMAIDGKVHARVNAEKFNRLVSQARSAA